MGNQKIKYLIKKILISFLFFGITTMNYADNFQIKHIYTINTYILSHHISSSSSSIVISSNNDVITDNLSGIFEIQSNEFGIFKVPLNTEMKQKMLDVNKLLRMPYIEKNLITNNPERGFSYQLNVDQPEIMKSQFIQGLQRNENINNFNTQQERNKAQHTIKVNDFIMDLVLYGISKNKVKFADFYGTTNIFPKSNGLEVILALKNVGPFDVTITNPKEWGEIPKVGEDVNTDHTWYEIVFGGLYKDISWTTRFGLESKYLIKDEIQSEKVLHGDFVIKSNSIRVLRFLIPYQDIKFRSNTGEIDGNRTKQGYVLLDYQAGVLDSNWNFDINFGGVFSDRTWKVEKTSLVRGWVNLE
ncbi:hypothetical protein [Acinetobacter rongchengensis]|uniref:Uncharacterized protein n=1 Tax=Acinetobacter rongchengensis TaxID=2419601 RepID=A0A3A8F357_9GAMM|nr:hypothetical protein [Acinetobacter rongchengensis]RKG40828.1 hypothetical protein D7V20_00085 [Acinetobacter rongchengensis]